MLRTQRLTKGISQAKVAELARISPASIARAERGENVTLPTIVNYSRYLGMSEAFIESASRFYKAHPGHYGSGPRGPQKNRKPKAKVMTASGDDITKVAAANGFHIHHETALALLRDAKTLLDNGRSNKLIATRISAALTVLELQDAE